MNPPAAAAPSPGPPAPMPPGVGPDSVACWEVDLSQVRALLEAVAEGTRWPDWVAALLHGARIVDVNARGLELVGSPVGREAMIDQPVASFCPHESWTILAELIAAVATDRPDHGVRSSAIESFMFRNALLSVWGQAGPGISGIVWVAVDGEMADDRSFWTVRASEQRYKRLIHHLPGALLQVDTRPLGAAFYRLRAEGVIDLAAHLADHPELVTLARDLVRVTDANRDAMQLFGVSEAASLVGPIAHVFAIAPDSARRLMIAHFEGRRSHVEQLRLRTFDRRVVDVRLAATFPTPPERLDVTLLSFEDITDRLRTEAQLRQLQADHARAARIASLGELAASIAHEVNQPLAAIAMNAQTSLRWLSRDGPDLAKVIQLTERIVDSAGHAGAIVRRIRGMAARHAPERSPLDLNALIEEALLVVRHDLEARAIGLSLTLARDLPPVRADRVQLQQVIVNLLVNSIQAMARSGARRRWIALETGSDGEAGVALTLRDGGPGIEPQHIDRVFEGFFTTKEEGIGIGLSICQSIIAAHGGEISCANQADGGALFRFSLPRAAGQEEDAGRHAADPGPAGSAAWSQTKTGEAAGAATAST